MDLAFMGRLLLSAAIFAPGLILLTFLLFVGVVMLAEKANLLRRTNADIEELRARVVSTDAVKNPAPGSITAGLTEALAEEEAETGEASGPTEQKVVQLKKGS